MCQFKTKDSEIKPDPLYLVNFSEYFTLINLIKTGSKASVKIFSVYYDAIDTSNILDMHGYLIKGKWCKTRFEFILKMCVVLLPSLVNASSHTKCASLSNQKCKIQLTLINLHPKYTSTHSMKLIQIDVVEIVILLITSLIKCEFNTKQKI